MCLQISFTVQTALLAATAAIASQKLSSYEHELSHLQRRLKVRVRQRLRAALVQTPVVRPDAGFTRMVQPLRYP